MTKRYQPNVIINQLFNDILKNKLKNNSYLIKSDDAQYTFEIINSDDTYIFGKIGRYKDMISFQLRDRETLESSKISKTNTQDLEVFTYLLIDRSNYLISYLKEQSAPSISVLSSLIDNVYGSTQSLFGEVSSIMIEDAIPILKKKDTIGSISYKVAVPSTEKINIDALGLSEKDFEMLQNQKSVQFEVKLVAERNKSAIEDPNKLEQFLKKIMKKTEKIKVSAKDTSEYMQTYNIVGSIMTKREKFEFDKDSTNIESEIEKKLKKTYENNKEEIQEYVVNE
ncbi:MULTISPECIES: hypothetical protein [unclassified Bacillus (in: firmicutes)]|uniref:hypothetical protein n=1 Tax=unclassified Bacillus (in: firmicutes) TaxID=185979 RepID=UPI001BE68521|nr:MULTISPECIES: hypothetical protein [unclassified Bacillus (in: firmicutes)]MBT2614142.1 hypothetical protein [Bacillus sp. ISL-78]MBT2629347.1 hypothetical protein [Bacillus sp. ISL-101]